MVEKRTRKTEFLTSTNHAFALIAYIVMFFQGILFLTGFAQARGVQALIGDLAPATTMWAFAYMVFGLGAFLSAILSPLFKRPNPMLKMEFAAVLGIGLVNIIYEVGLASQGFDFAVTTQFYALAYIFGSLLRCAQIQRDLYVLRRKVKRKVSDDLLSSR